LFLLEIHTYKWKTNHPCNTSRTKPIFRKYKYLPHNGTSILNLKICSTNCWQCLLWILFIKVNLTVQWFLPHLLNKGNIEASFRNGPLELYREWLRGDNGLGGIKPRFTAYSIGESRPKYFRVLIILELNLVFNFITFHYMR
jgi:hypothetical protein